MKRARSQAEIMHKAMMAFAKKLSKDPVASLKFLQRAGIVTKKGRMAKAYRGGKKAS